MCIYISLGHIFGSRMADLGHVYIYIYISVCVHAYLYLKTCVFI